MTMGRCAMKQESRVMENCEKWIIYFLLLLFVLLSFFKILIKVSRGHQRSTSPPLCPNETKLVAIKCATF
ncbi:hypothetical protein GDO81_016119 [Engystomops pustulosus]|uniref:Uncharacterized protein n=1 Tax=Engystomops pustulosus TaxID=76066 RepID=A0AAV7AUA2_ENGPU|nr:hypothetical protein GDO81_016119 [Engystomops pustulosus]